MKFPRNVRIFRGQLDAAPFASVFLVLVAFILLHSLVFTPGVRVPLRLPEAEGLPGVAGPTVAVAVDQSGQLYFENQLISESGLSNRLYLAAQKSSAALTLVVQADKAMTEETLVHLALLASHAGIQELSLATLPRIADQSPGTPKRP